MEQSHIDRVLVRVCVELIRLENVNRFAPQIWQNGVLLLGRFGLLVDVCALEFELCLSLSVNTNVFLNWIRVMQYCAV